MDCSLIARELIAYHFEACDEATHAAVESHLVECAVCVRSYVSLKAAFRRGAAEERPREDVRARVRHDVEQAFARSSRVGIWKAFKRPIPLYQGIGVALAAAAIALAVPRWLGSHEGQRAWPGPYVDTSRQVAESMSIY
jgi:hypothetical protein